MRVVVQSDTGDEIFRFDDAIDRGRDYQSDAPQEEQAAIMRALTEALRFVLHVQQPPER